MNNMWSPLPFNGVDYAVLALLFYGAIRGLIRGLSGELARAVSVLALLVTVYYAHPLTDRLLKENTRLMPEASPLVALILLSVAALGLFLLGRAIVKKVFSRSFSGMTERLGGAAAGLLSSALLASLLLLAASLIQNETVQRAVVQQSWFGRHAHTVLPDAYRRVSKRYGLPPLPSPADSDSTGEEQLDPSTDRDNPSRPDSARRSPHSPPEEMP